MLPAAFLPLETLPSWPAVPEPTLVELLTVTLFVPFAIAAVVVALVMGPAWHGKSE